jgi:rod shape-determining protein MreB
MKDGVITDVITTEKTLQSFIRKVYQYKMLQPSPRVLVCVPVGATQVERRAIRRVRDRRRRAKLSSLKDPS